MILTKQQIESITCGAAQIVEEGGGLRFWRFTEHQQQLYSQLRPVLTKIKNYRPTSTTSAGVRLAFRTDSCHLGLKVDVFRGSPRTFFSFDILVNGQYFDSLDNFGDNIYPQGEPKTVYPLGIHEKEFTLPAGEKTVEVYFPWSVCPILQAMTLDDGATLTPVKRSKTYIAFGDSITQGYDILRPWQHHVQHLGRLLDADLVNKGIGGEIFFPPLADSPDPLDPDYITVAYGTNDMVHVDGSRFDEDVAAFYGSLRKHYPRAKIFAITPIWRPNFNRPEEFDTIENMEKRIAAAVADIPGVIYIRGYDFIPQDTKILSDWVTHPNDEGFAYYRENFCKAIKEYV